MNSKELIIRPVLDEWPTVIERDVAPSDETWVVSNGFTGV